VVSGERNVTVAKVRVLADRCISSGNCLDVASDAFDMDDDGLVIALVDEVDGPLRERVELAARVCPVQAILLEE
jgi:3-phenylpropionate/trans-cinnamate dioxygenase ferredoxin reductase subunit